MRSLLRLAVAALFCGVGCAPGAETETRTPLTQRQRDSVLARSGLPGSPVLGRALEVSDRAEERAAGVAAVDTLFR